MNTLTTSYLSTDFDNYELLNKSYLILYVSFFDHVLTEEEYASADIVCYADVKNNPRKKILFNTIKDTFVLLYKSLYELSQEEVLVSLNGNLSKIKSYDEYNNYVVNAIKEQPLCCLL